MFIVTYYNAYGLEKSFTAHTENMEQAIEQAISNDDEYIKTVGVWEV